MKHSRNENKYDDDLKKRQDDEKELHKKVESFYCSIANKANIHFFALYYFTFILKNFNSFLSS